MTEPRQFWLDKLSKDNHGWLDAIPLNKGDNEVYENYLRVIEFSAYQELQEKLKVAEDFIAERCCIDDCGFDVREEPREVLEACMIAIDFEGREALAKIRGEGEILSC